MRRSGRLALAALAATLVLAAALSSASAGRLSSSSQTFRVVWTPLSFAGSIFGSMRCNITMEGSFHSSTIVKNLGALIGHVTSAQVARPCTSGEAWVYNGSETILGVVQRNSLPWHVTYSGFTGTLPNIEDVAFTLSLFRFALSNTICLSIYGPNKTLKAEIALSGGGAGTTVTPNGETLAQESGTCGSGAFTGEGQITVLGSTSRVTITLI